MAAGRLGTVSDRKLGCWLTCRPASPSQRRLPTPEQAARRASRLLTARAKLGFFSFSYCSMSRAGAMRPAETNSAFQVPVTHPTSPAASIPCTWNTDFVIVRRQLSRAGEVGRTETLGPLREHASRTLELCISDLQPSRGPRAGIRRAASQWRLRSRPGSPWARRRSKFWMGAIDARSLT